MTVEGGKYINQKLVGRVDSTEPGTIQRIIDYDPAVIVVSCDEHDSHGSLEMEGDSGLVTVMRAKEKDDEQWEVDAVLDRGDMIEFSGNERVLVRFNTPVETNEIVFWHRRGSAGEPPYRRERVPLLPGELEGEASAEAVPETERALVSTRG